MVSPGRGHWKPVSLKDLVKTIQELLLQFLHEKLV